MTCNSNYHVKYQARPDILNMLEEAEPIQYWPQKPQVDSIPGRPRSHSVIRTSHQGRLIIKMWQTSDVGLPSRTKRKKKSLYNQTQNLEITINTRDTILSQCLISKKTSIMRIITVILVKNLGSTGETIPEKHFIFTTIKSSNSCQMSNRLTFSVKWLVKVLLEM